METERIEHENSTDEMSLNIPTTQIYDKIIEQSKAVFSESFFKNNVIFFSKYGLLCLYATAVVGLLISIVAATKTDSFTFFLIGIGWSLLCLVLQYIAVKFLPLSKSIIDSTPSKLSSEAFLECFSIIFFLSAIILFITFTVLAIQVESLNTFFVGIGFFVIFSYLFTISINPSLVNITIESDVTAGEEAIGILSFIMKGFLRMAPILFGIGVIIGTVHLLLSSLNLFGDYPEFALLGIMFSGISVLVLSGIPFLFFLSFIFYYLTIDVLRSIIEIPKMINTNNKILSAQIKDKL